MLQKLDDKLCDYYISIWLWFHKLYDFCKEVIKFLCSKRSDYNVRKWMYLDKERYSRALRLEIASAEWWNIGFVFDVDDEHGEHFCSFCIALPFITAYFTIDPRVFSAEFERKVRVFCCKIGRMSEFPRNYEKDVRFGFRFYNPFIRNDSSAMIHAYWADEYFLKDSPFSWEYVRDSRREVVGKATISFTYAPLNQERQMTYYVEALDYVWHIFRKHVKLGQFLRCSTTFYRLDYEFNEETGENVGTWKGGLLSSSQPIPYEVTQYSRQELENLVLAEAFKGAARRKR